MPTKRDRFFNTLATLILIIAGFSFAYLAIVFFAPDSPINPLSPIALPTAANTLTPVPTSTSTATPTQSPTPTDTPTPTSSPTSTPMPTPSPSPVITMTVRATSVFARSATPTRTPRVTPTITPTPDICSTLKLIAPRNAQHFNQNETAELTWTFGRVLEPDEHFNVLLDPPGQGIGSIAWADEERPELKNCTTTRCVYPVGLGRYPGGRFNWTIGVIIGGGNHQVIGQVCKPPEPFNFTYLTLQ